MRRVDAVVAGDEIGLPLAEELQRLAPFGIGNPGVTLLVPAARCSDPRTMGEDGKHVRFTVASGAASARAVAFGTSTIDCDNPLDATFTLELNEYNGSVEPRLLLRDARPSAPAPIALVGEPAATRRLPRRRARRDRRGRCDDARAQAARPGGAGARPPRRRDRGNDRRARRLRRARARRRRRRARRACATCSRSSAASRCARTTRSSATRRWRGWPGPTPTSSCSTRPPVRCARTAR